MATELLNTIKYILSYWISIELSKKIDLLNIELLNKYEVIDGM